MNFQGISIRELAVFLSDHLTGLGVEVVLTGGACVSIYTQNRFLSYDLDFVLLDFFSRKKVRKILEDLDFKPEGRHFRHHDTPFIVEFLSPPLSVGEEPVKKIMKIEERGRTLRLLSPTDCVKDRLSAFYHWNDKPCLEQAAMVCQCQPVDLKEIRRWSGKEGMGDRYFVFIDEFEKKYKV